MKNQFKRSIRFSLSIAVITFVLAALFSVVSTLLLEGVLWYFGILVVLGIVLIGVMFDMLGIASTAADEVPLNAMASNKVYGARQAIIIVKNADKFASFCNDVIGDISGIVSGTASAFVVLQLTLGIGFQQESTMHTTVSVIFTSVVAALTVGGKALGKYFAIHASTSIILFAGKVIAFLEDKLHLKLLPDLKKSR
ncbi:hypothetical protein EDD68_10833 [Melghiribacillus thermohalophilus]|uniref:CNNM transmembrane domain-containing protein n=2 Tax=Melghiribacillus thermohalophilus TaxID=1324956 RepID=A0A4R3N1L9_9BACI|nr:hypothetical protein [Melghiribacillus thermohalophilus]TCT22614.1 hypothetical protein EDD68_10833 [Melghiribacillus thermohalophilus]